MLAAQSLCPLLPHPLLSLPSNVSQQPGSMVPFEGGTPVKGREAKRSLRSFDPLLPLGRFPPSWARPCPPHPPPSCFCFSLSININVNLSRTRATPPPPLPPLSLHAVSHRRPRVLPLSQGIFCSFLFFLCAHVVRCLLSLSETDGLSHSLDRPLGVFSRRARSLSVRVRSRGQCSCPPFAPRGTAHTRAQLSTARRL